MDHLMMRDSYMLFMAKLAQATGMTLILIDFVRKFPDLMSPSEVAQALGVAESDVISLITSGELRAKKIGRNYRIKRSSVDEFLAD